MHCTLTISSAHRQLRYPQTHPSLGVAAPDLLPGVKASRSLASSASARRLRKSERCTSPTVCDWSRSSVVEFCALKRGF